MSDADKQYLYPTIGAAVTQPTWMAVLIFFAVFGTWPETAWKKVDGEA